MVAYASTRHSRSVAAWLAFMVFLVAAMILLGGATRMTNSGLSITEWKPITGAIPPLSQEGWAEEFAKYKLIPEFSAEHPDMDLQGFKFIFFMEWSHRQLGRFIGLAYFLPLVLFSILGRIPKGRRFRFYGILLLIGLQGAIGWWMVASGLVNDRVDVSPYRLTIHLGLAFVILAFLFWTWRDQAQEWPVSDVSSRHRGLTAWMFIVVFIQILAGALVAGTRAGYTYNTWPLMDGGFIPNGYWVMTPKWANLFENVASVQFNHRTLAYIVLAFALWVWASVRRSEERDVVRSVNWLMGAIILQVVLGIVALLKVIELPYAMAHQAGAIVVFLFALSAMRNARIRRF